MADKEDSKEDKLDKGRVLCRCIIEMLGAPKEHIEQTLKDYIKQIKEDDEEHRNYEFVKEEYAEAVPAGKLFSNFVELEIWFKGIPELIAFCFDSMPSSIEILEPQHFKLNASDFSGLLNDLQAKLHQIDMGLKNLNAKHKILERNSSALLRNLILSVLKQGPIGIDKLSGNVGIPKDQLKPFLEKLIKDNFIKFDENIYKLP